LLLSRRAVPPPHDSPRRLAIVWSQDELYKRTLAGRLIAHHGPRVLRGLARLALALIVCAAVGIALAEQALHPAVRHLGLADEAAARQLARAHSASLDDVPLVAPDGALLRAWSFTPPGRARATVLALHGLGDNRASQLRLAGLLVANGYGVVAPDWRMHGASGGAMATYGLRERADLRAWSAWIRERRPDECLFAAGASMGAAIVLQALGEESFCAVIAEAPYATFRGAAALRVGNQFGLPPAVGRVAARPFVEAGMVYARLRYGLAFWRANPVDGIASARVPVLVIEDGADDRVPAGDAVRLAAANPRAVTVWQVPGARHVGSWTAAPEEYPRRVLAFLAAHQ
jgi:hypothetical protein